MKITIFCSDRNHPVFPYIHGWEKENSSKHEIHLTNNINEIKNGDLLFLIAVTQIVKSDIRNRFKKTLCVHESDLPEGRGWSPVVYAVLNNEKKISMSLFEVNDGIDSGDIWKKIFFNIEKHEIASEINHKVSIKTIELMNFAIENFNDIKPIPQDDSNITTYLERRTPDDSQLDVGKTIAEQFNQIRIADENGYPCFFNHKGYRYKLTIKKYEKDIT